MKFEKKTYHVMRNGGFVEPVEGYEFEAAGHTWYVKAEGTGKGKTWKVTDPGTGLCYVSGRTRKEAAEAAVEKVGEYEKLTKLARYQEQKRKFDEYMDKMPKLDAEQLARNRALKDVYGDGVRIEMEDADGVVWEVTESGVRRIGVKDVKVTDEKGDEVEATVEPKTVEVREAKPEPPREDDDIELVDVAAEVSIETLREFADGKNLAVTQKNERSLVWVRGDTEPHKEQLKEMGLRYSRKKEGWWLKVA